MATNKSLQRLPEQGQIFGICAGLAAYLELDVVLIRVLFVILAFVTGGGFIVLYLILAFVIPTASVRVVGKAADTDKHYDIGEKVQDLSQELRVNRSVDKLRNYFGIGLLALGAWLLLAEFLPGWIDFRWAYVWPILLIVVGILMITRKGK